MARVKLGNHGQVKARLYSRTNERAYTPPIQTNHVVIQAINMVRRVPGTDTLRQFFQPLQVKGGIPIGIRYEQELAAIRARITAPPVE